jgi:hypothetical protein
MIGRIKMSVVITILVIITILIGIGQTIDNYKKNQEAARKQAEIDMYGQDIANILNQDNSPQ